MTCIVRDNLVEVTYIACDSLVEVRTDTILSLSLSLSLSRPLTLRLATLRIQSKAGSRRMQYTADRINMQICTAAALLLR